MLQLLDTRRGFPRPSLKEVFDNFFSFLSQNSKMELKHTVDATFVNCLAMMLKSSSGVMVKRLACCLTGTGFDSWSRRYNIRDWLSPATKSLYG